MSGPDTAPYELPGGQEPPKRPRSHRAPQEPTTGPMHRIPFPPAGRHQEDDLDPKRWPWIILVLVATILAGGGGVAWGRASAYDSQRAEAAEIYTAEPVPAPTETVTKTPKPKAGPTVTRTAKASPRPTVTVTASPSPGPTIYRMATPRPRPTVTRTREIPVCYQSDLDERLEEIPCP